MKDRIADDREQLVDRRYIRKPVIVDQLNASGFNRRIRSHGAEDRRRPELQSEQAVPKTKRAARIRDSVRASQRLKVAIGRNSSPMRSVCATTLYRLAGTEET